MPPTKHRIMYLLLYYGAPGILIGSAAFHAWMLNFPATIYAIGMAWLVVLINRHFKMLSLEDASDPTAAIAFSMARIDSILRAMRNVHEREENFEAAAKIRRAQERLMAVFKEEAH